MISPEGEVSGPGQRRFRRERQRRDRRRRRRPAERRSAASTRVMRVTRSRSRDGHRGRPGVPERAPGSDGPRPAAEPDGLERLRPRRPQARPQARRPTRPATTCCSSTPSGSSPQPSPSSRTRSSRPRTGRRSDAPADASRRSGAHVGRRRSRRLLVRRRAQGLPVHPGRIAHLARRAVGEGRHLRSERQAAVLLALRRRLHVDHRPAVRQARRPLRRSRSPRTVCSTCSCRAAIRPGALWRVHHGKKHEIAKGRPHGSGRSRGRPATAPSTSRTRARPSAAARSSGSAADPTHRSRLDSLGRGHRPRPTRYDRRHDGSTAQGADRQARASTATTAAPRCSRAGCATRASRSSTRASARRPR